MEKNALEQARRNKLDIVKERVNPHPERFEVTHDLKDIKDLDDGVTGVSAAGRITFMRKMGKLSFIVLSDLEGRIQVALKKDLLGEETYDLFKKGIDVGDFVGVSGEMFTTNTGEKTLRASEFTFLGKSLRPLPEKFHGMTDVESRYRQRYLDLIMNETTRDVFLKRIAFIKSIRRFLEDHNYLEIETPVLTDHASGASARPFVSHHNALDIDVYLRIAPETYLKRAIVGGFTKVFEFARCFRNEGIDATHLQDFTMLEGYAAYYNYKDNMVFLKELLVHAVQDVFGSTEMEIEGKTIDLSGDWPVYSFRDLILKDCGIDIDQYKTAPELLEVIKEKKIALDADSDIKKLGRGNLIDLLYKKVSRPSLINPTFLTQHPTDLSPLARANDDNPEIVDRFQLIINGAEVINAYSELVDADEQRARLSEQAKLKAGGDEEAMVMDDDYIKAMEYGMPPISGWGIGIDRVLQIFTNQDNIKDTILFPLLRPLNEDNGEEKSQEEK